MEQQILDISRSPSSNERLVKAFMKGEKLPRKQKKKAKQLAELANKITDKYFKKVT